MPVDVGITILTGTTGTETGIETNTDIAAIGTIDQDIRLIHTKY